MNKRPTDIQPPAYRPPAGPMHARFVNDVAPRRKPAGAAAAKAPAVRKASGHFNPDLVRLRAGNKKQSKVNDVHIQREPGAGGDKPASAPLGARRWSFQQQETWRDHPGRTATLVVCGLLFGGLSLFSLELGQIVLAVYAIVALWRRWPSRQTFTVALGMFGGIIVTSLVEAWRPLADNLAVYAFLLLCLGVLQMGLEMRRDNRSGAADDVIRPGDELAAQEGAYVRQRSL